MQQQVQQTTNPQQKTQFKNQIHEEISERTQKQSQAFAEQSPKIKKSEVTNNLRIRR